MYVDLHVYAYVHLYLSEAPQVMFARCKDFDCRGRGALAGRKIGDIPSGQTLKITYNPEHAQDMALARRQKGEFTVAGGGAMSDATSLSCRLDAPVSEETKHAAKELYDYHNQLQDWEPG